MGQYTIGLIAHGGAGKTTLGESMLFLSGVIKKLGSVDEGTSALDWEEEEKERRAGVHSDLAWFNWEGHQVDLIDPPGSMNFIGSALAAIRAIDSAVMVSSAEPGIQGQTEFLWEHLNRLQSPRLMVINKMDRDQADFEARLAYLNEAFENRMVPLTLPIGKGESFRGIVDLIEMCAWEYSGDKPVRGEIPADMAERVESARARLVEAAAEGDDDLMEKYLETEVLEPAEVLTGIREATLDRKMVPVYCSAANSGMGVEQILNGMVRFLPDVEARTAHRRSYEKAPDGYVADSHENSHFSALVFKTKIDHYAGKLSIVRVLSGELTPATDLLNTTNDHNERPAHLYKLVGKEQTEVKSLKAGELGALPKLGHTRTGDTLCSPKNKVEFQPLDIPQPVLTYALLLSGKGEEEKLSTSLHRMIDEDPTLSYSHNVETGDFLVSGMGQIHLDLVLQRLKKEFNISAEYGLPHVPYRETIRIGSKAQGKYKKQTGGRGQYGDCWLELKPNSHAEELVFNNAVVGGAIPRQYIPAVEKGVAEAMHKGVIAGFPVIGVDATVYDGTYHDVDSSEMAFKIAGSMAFKKAMEGAKPVLLEPIVEMEILVNADYTGDVMGDINARRGRVLGMDSRGKNQVVRAEVPLGEALTYAVDLRAMTSGQGFFSQRFSRYEEAPPQVSEKVIRERDLEHAAEG